MSGKPIVKGPIDGNAGSVMGAVTRALRRAGQGDKVAEYREKAMSGDYHHLLAVSMDYVDFDLGPDEPEEERDSNDEDETDPNDD